MTSVLSYRPLSDPFAADPATRYPNNPHPPFASTHPTSSSNTSSPHHPAPAAQLFTAPTPTSAPSAMQPPAHPQRASTGPMPPAGGHRSTPPTSFDEFGSHSAGGSHSQSQSQSTSAARARSSHSQSVVLPVPVPSSSVSADHSTAQAARQRNRQSHNPSATLTSVSPPKPEYLTDEYVLHPSVWTYKQAHPRRQMVGFGPYVLLQTLGEGEFGKVKLGVHTEYGVEVAIKLIRRGSLEDEVRASKVEREIDVLKTLKHPNIVRMFDVIDTDKYIGIVLEFAGGGELFDHILANRHLREKDAQKLFAQLISGVDYLHKKHIVHRDLKLENLLLDKHRNIIITDFGFANRFDHETDDLMATSCGSPCYAAPELVVSEGLYVGSAVDIWSCGVILYAMLSGYLPYDDDPANPDGDNINLLYKYIMSTKLNFPDHMSPAAKHLLQIMLVPNPEHRCRVTDIMSHPWLAEHTDIFTRSVEDHEYIFQENMYRKSQMAKRELAARRQVQQEGKMAKLAMARSHSSVPGSTVTASMLDQNRRARDVRHHSALPGATTMPEYLNNGGRRTPIPVPAPVVPVAQTSPIIADAAIMSPSANAFSTPPAVTPVYNLTPPPPRSANMAPALSHTNTDASVAHASTTAVENAPMDIEPTTEAVDAPSTPEKKRDSPQRPPMSANKNRHTIQVEYDGEASYEKMKEVLEAKRTAAGMGASIPDMPNALASSPTPRSSPHSPHKRVLTLQQATSDIEMESASSDQGHTHEGTFESTLNDLSEGATPEASQVLTPPAFTPPATAILEEPPVSDTALPSTPSRKGKEPERLTSPSTPRATQQQQPEDVMTPRAAKVNVVTPKASLPAQSTSPRSGGKRFDSMPARSSAPPKASPMLPPSNNPSLNAAGLPNVPPPRKDRSRKGMSLDKFGLARLLGSSAASSSVDVSRPPPSAGLAARGIQEAQEAGVQRSKRGSLIRPRTAENENKDKKTRRRTLQLMVNRSSSPRPTVPPTPLTARDLNPATPATASSSLSKGHHSPPLIIDSEGIQPAPIHDRGQSSPSIVTVDAFAAQQADPSKYQASSSAAKKVMDWFRRKSMAKDTLAGLKTAGLKSDSTSSFVRVGDSPARPIRDGRIGESQPNLGTMSSTSSVAHDTPNIMVTEEKERGAAVPDSATLPREQEEGREQGQVKTSESLARIPLGSAASKTNIPSVSASDLLSPNSRSGGPPLSIPTRSKSLVPDASTSPATPAQTQSLILPAKIPLRTSPAPRIDETKMRVHTGLVDQSALSSKPPKDVIAEVLKVLQEMGMDIKKENEFRLRCTRVRRRKSGATTGLGLGSVISVGSGMSPFTLMSNASASRTDSRGLPLPSTPSGGLTGGLKGMLLRRGSSYSSTHHGALPRSDSDILGSPSASSIGLGSPQVGSPATQHEPLYGEHSIDSGDEVKFVIELCRIKNLPGLYLLNIKRLRGSVWSFKFIYQTVLERCQTLTH